MSIGTNFKEFFDNKKCLSGIFVGYFNGIIYSIGWGLFFGSYTYYSPEKSAGLYMKNIFKYMGKTGLKLAPICAVARGVSGFLQSKGYSETSIFIATLISFAGLAFLLNFP